ncbi:MAG: exopolysaccharide biosynthesis polyprenyl glycosylphosphotransferase [Paramuribaculum sp.]|nr:exopolysaccharide biosynthesis polyprenyl glycosylphosphotransferase [Paramuribaculum sp.]
MNTRTRQKMICVGVDFVSTSVAWLLFDIARYYLLDVGYSSLSAFLLSSVVMAGQVLFPLIMLAIYWLSGYYNEPLHRSRAQEVLTTFGSCVAGAFLALMVMLVNDLSSDRVEDYRLMGVMLGILFVCVYFPRLLVTNSLLRRIKQGKLSFKTSLIALTPLDSDELFRDMEQSLHPGAGMVVSRRDVIGENGEGMAELVEAGSRNEIDCYLIVRHNSTSVSRMLYVIGGLLPVDKPIFIKPEVDTILTQRLGPGMPGTRMKLGSVDREPLLDVSRTEMSAMTLNLKRVADVVVSAAALAVIWPIIGVLAVMVKLDSEGPAFYRQPRIGYHRRPFNIYKLRTMKVDAESSGPQLTSTNDNRVTRLGKFLRKYRLDELPQFLNVLKGDMSLVGPRPEREYYVNEIMKRSPGYALLHQLRPGITSWGMVRYGYASTVDQMIERMRYDLLYLENVGFAVDMKILLHTLHTVISGKGQ